MGGSWVFAGLGNPGPEYAETRHNIGWMVLDRFADLARIELDELIGDARVGRGRYAGSQLWLVEPQSYMNRSGRPVSKVLGEAGVTWKELVVIHDDLDLEIGRLKMQKGRGAGGHNGVEDVIQQLGTSGFARVRIGIGRPGPHEDGSDFVLTPFGEEERKEHIEAAIDRAVEALKIVAQRGLTAAMNDINRRERERLAPTEDEPATQPETESEPENKP